MPAELNNAVMLIAKTILIINPPLGLDGGQQKAPLTGGAEWLA
jgi:hypothetical protein